MDRKHVCRRLFAGIFLLFCLVSPIQFGWSSAHASEAESDQAPLFSDYVVFDCCRWGMAVWKDSFSQGVISNKGEWILPPVYAEIRCNDEGIAAWDIGTSSWEFYDWEGQKLYEADIYEEAYPFSCGYAVVMDMDCNYYYIDQMGNKLVDTPFDGAESFIAGFACIIQEDQYYLISTAGDVIAGPFARCCHVTDGLYDCEDDDSAFYYDCVENAYYDRRGDG